MENLDRTKDGALQTLLELLREQAAAVAEDADGLPSESLLRDIFDKAWHFQFEEDRHQSRREIRELVQDAVLATQLGDDG
ncbi:MAG TPA: hypothetical protein VMW58_05430 [Anaerolineae bacterium]|nr:hypothetical protein [Anaerolineae bacterium]